MNSLQPLNAVARLNEFHATKDGWLDGARLAPTPPAA